MLHRQADPADPQLVAALADAARRTVGDRAGPPVVLSHRTGELVLRCGGVVVKAHAEDTDRAALTARLGLLGMPAARRVLLAPLATAELDGRPVTIWPAGAALRPHDALSAPWDSAGALLAGLHAVPLPPGLPEAGGPARVRRAIVRLGQSPASVGPRARAVRAAYDSLPARARGAPPFAGDPGSHRPPALTHGDWHLGQLVRCAAGWRLIDIDDVGGGDPVWDLARPAAWFAAGIMPPRLWGRFLDGYRAAGGSALPATGDPWPVLDPPARALCVQIAALAIVNGDLDVAEAFVACCRRITLLDETSDPPSLSKLLRI